jgi:hypothetical protein
MALGLAVVGCGNNECEDAADKVDECGIDQGASKPSDDDVSECNEKSECYAKCFNSASCDDIKTLAKGFTDCLGACPQ